MQKVAALTATWFRDDLSDKQTQRKCKKPHLLEEIGLLHKLYDQDHPIRLKTLFLTFLRFWGFIFLGNFGAPGCHKGSQLHHPPPDGNIVTLGELHHSLFADSQLIG